jgi:hypothetical protein
MTFSKKSKKKGFLMLFYVKKITRIKWENKISKKEKGNNLKESKLSRDSLLYKLLIVSVLT